MSQADLTVQGHSTAGAMAEPAFSVPAKKMAMWLFIIADSATFAGCLVAYGFIPNASTNWPRPFHSITNVAVMTLILLTSSLTMLIGVRAAQAGDKPKAFRWVMITAVAGILFAALHLRLFEEFPWQQCLQFVTGVLQRHPGYIVGAPGGMKNTRRLSCRCWPIQWESCTAKALPVTM